MATTATGERVTKKSALELLEDACARRLEAERTIKTAKTDSENARNDALPLFEQLGVKEIPVDHEGICYVATTASEVDEAAIEAYIKRYAPERYDTIFPQKRVFRPDILKALVQTGDVGATALTHMKTKAGSPRLTIYKVKS